MQTKTNETTDNPNPATTFSHNERLDIYVEIMVRMTRGKYSIRNPRKADGSIPILTYAISILNEYGINPNANSPLSFLPEILYLETASVTYKDAIRELSKVVASMNVKSNRYIIVTC